jgi:hypothetical protein
MLKAATHTEEGTKILILGLSSRNLTLLSQGKSIEFDATPYGFAGRIVIFHGLTEMEMAEMILSDNGCGGLD